MKRTLFVGFDAACWEFFDPLIKRGCLPHIQQLMESGSWGVLESTLPAQTPTAWSSIITGKNPGKHGIYDFLLRIPGQKGFVPPTAKHRLEFPFWKWLNENGLRVGLVNVPFTYPIEPLEGFLVCGFGSPNTNEGIVYPENEIGWISEHIDGFRPIVDPMILRRGTAEEIYRAERKNQSQFIDIALELSSRYQVDVLVINLLFPDHANHKMPRMEDVERAIIASDNDLGRLINHFEPDNVMLFSDHGSRRVKGDFLLHAWLRDKGYCVQLHRTPAERADSMNWVLKTWFEDRGWSGRTEKIARKITSKGLLRLPGGKSSIYWRIVDTQIPFAYEHVFLKEDLDTSRSQILLGSSYSGVLHFNDNGYKFPEMNSTDDRTRRLSSSIEELSERSDPDTGQSLFTKVYKSDSIYNGPATQLAPDLIIDIYDSPWNILSTYRRGYLGESVKNRYFAQNSKDFGHHSKYGIFIFSGQDFKPDTNGLQGHVMDLPATILYLYDIPVPNDFDGHVMSEVINSEFIDRHPFEFQPGERKENTSLNYSVSSEEDELLVEHLRALGYLD